MAETRTAAQRDSNRAAIADRYLRGETQASIAASLEIDQSTVSRDLKYLQGQWQARAADRMDAHKAAELAKLDALERTYWAAWEASTQAQKRTRIADRAGVKASEVGSVTRDGNPAFLAGVMACIDRRCKLLGIDAPTKSEHTGKDGAPLIPPRPPGLVHLTTEELLMLEALVAKTVQPSGD